MTIHREGYRYVFFATALFVFVALWLPDLLPMPNWVYWLAFATCAFFLVAFLQFFRNPNVRIQKDDKAILAPAEGKVVVIEEVVETEYLKQPCRQVSIFMSPINVHVNRSPLSGLVTYQRYHPGKYLVAWHPKSSTENERTTVVIKHASTGREVLLRQIAGALARRIRLYTQPGHQVQQGAEFGFIKFGSRVDVFLPLDVDIRVALGEKTQAGKQSWPDCHSHVLVFSAQLFQIGFPLFFLC